MNTVENNLIQIQANKEMTALYKDFLEMLEDIRNDHQILLQKVTEKTSLEFANSINYFTDSKYEQFRKRILDRGNGHLRQLMAFLSFFEFTIDKEKVIAAANQRVVTKKFITSMPVEIK